MPPLNDLTGKRFGRLKVIMRDGAIGSGRTKWLCECDCGNRKSVVGAYLTQGCTRSCGCLHAEILVKQNKSAEKIASTAKWNGIYKRKHGGTGSRLYKIWNGMKGRCYNANDPSFKHYGGRGITVCDEWRTDFDAFRAWAMENGYDENAAYGVCTIDRIDMNGAYTPSNCRWVSIAEQNKNKRPGGRRCVVQQNK